MTKRVEIDDWFREIRAFWGRPSPCPDCVADPDWYCDPCISALAKQLGMSFSQTRKVYGKKPERQP
jgi:hypothetical protein